MLCVNSHTFTCVARRDRQLVLHHCIRAGDVDQDVQPGSPGLRRVPLQPIRLPHRHLQHRRGDFHLHKRAATSWRQCAPMRTPLEAVQVHAVNGCGGKWFFKLLILFIQLINLFNFKFTFLTI